MKKIISSLIVIISFFHTGFSQGLTEINLNSQKEEFTFESIIGQFEANTFAYSYKNNLLIVSTFSDGNTNSVRNNVIKLVNSEGKKLTFLSAVMTLNGPVVFGYTQSKESQNFYALSLTQEGSVSGEPVLILQAKTIKNPLSQNLIIKTDINRAKIILSYFRQAPKQKNYTIDVVILNTNLKQLTHSQPVIAIESHKKGTPYLDFQVYLDTDLEGYFATVESAIIAKNREFDHNVIIHYYDESGKVANTNLVESSKVDLFKPVMTPSRTEDNITITGFYKPKESTLIEGYSGLYSTEYGLHSLEQHQSIQAPFKEGFVKYNFPKVAENVNGKQLVPLDYSINRVESTTQGNILVFIQEKKFTVNKTDGEKTIQLGNLVILDMNKKGIIAWSQLVPFSVEIRVKNNLKSISYPDTELAEWRFSTKTLDDNVSILYKKPTKQLEDGSFLYQTLWQTFYLEDGKPNKSKENGFYDKNEQLVYLTMYNRLISIEQ